MKKDDAAKKDDLMRCFPLRGLYTFRLLILLAAVAALMASVPAHAYDVDSGHVPLTNFSLKLYNACYPSNPPYQETGARERLIQGNRGMDKGRGSMLRHVNLSEAERAELRGDSVFSLMQRIWNWHFYNPGRTEFSRVGLVEQSHGRLWKRLEKGLSANRESNKLLFLGGLLHLVEDVSVPAHSIPVYHGPVSVAELGPNHLAPLVTYMRKAGRVRNGQIRDPVDWIGPDEKRLAETLLPTEEFCSAAGNGAETPEDIRDHLARTVYALLQTPISGCDGVSWSDLWLMPVGREYFGRYNIGEGRPLFGETGTVRSRNGRVCEMKKQDDRYDDFVLKLHQEAIKADMKLLRWGERQMVSEPLTIQALE